MTTIVEGQVLDATAIKAFAARYDPQPFHLDEAAAAISPFGGLVASGWHSVALTFSMLERRMDSPFQLASIESVRWTRPVRAGAHIALQALSCEAIAGDPGDRRQRVSVSMIADGEPAMTMRCTVAPAAAEVTATPSAPVDWTGDGQSLSAPFGDIVVGDTAVIGRPTASLQDVAWFCETFGRHGGVQGSAQIDGEIYAPRWQIASYWMAGYVRTRQTVAAARRANGLPVPSGGPSPGFGKMLWSRDVRVGEVLTYGLEIIAKRRQPRSEWAILTTKGGALDRFGVPVMTFEGHILWPAT